MSASVRYASHCVCERPHHNRITRSSRSFYAHAQHHSMTLSTFHTLIFFRTLTFHTLTHSTRSFHAHHTQTIHEDSQIRYPKERSSHSTGSTTM